MSECSITDLMSPVTIDLFTFTTYLQVFRVL